MIAVRDGRNSVSTESLAGCAIYGRRAELRMARSDDRVTAQARFVESVTDGPFMFRILGNCRILRPQSVRNRCIVPFVCPVHLLFGVHAQPLTYQSTVVSDGEAGHSCLIRSTTVLFHN